MLQREVGTFRIARIAEEGHLLIHCAAHGTTPRKVGLSRQDDDEHKRNDAEEETEQEPGLNLSSFPVCNVCAQCCADTQRGYDDDWFHYFDRGASGRFAKIGFEHRQRRSVGGAANRLDTTYGELSNQANALSFSGVTSCAAGIRALLVVPSSSSPDANVNRWRKKTADLNFSSNLRNMVRDCANLSAFSGIVTRCS